MTLGEQPDFVGNERQLKILQKALEEENILIWNKFNNSNGPRFKANLKGINLSGLKLKEINLNRANLTAADLTATDLRFAKMEEVMLSGANLENADLRGANLNGADLSGSSLLNCNLSKAKLGRVNLNDADLKGADMTDASLTGAQVKPENLAKTIMSNTKLPGKIKIISKTDETSAPPWLKAKNEEEQRKAFRLNKEKEVADEIEKKQLRRLGIKKQPYGSWDDED
ncbi:MULTISPECIES: pentapeptide repeat-containing protein [unclassified Oceanispirochaeta]|uniref:pentapeptide repeat-containing protein n=1 Tax=unclassified Oceanispirochaeta TaxID=2635722 RepID=UPI001313F04E|nr:MULTISPECIES: pentapeptide repeat-containing protein [unclassified Oceanispirochaeta]MBF9018038.1 pentapeptide repeat-containing protein [Oceanispirochaeta sp. M2]NPD73881.1 pentapeptide repeat-containing protein [Oceanispirochaeta sp. M1]